MSETKTTTPAEAKASSNWLALQKVLNAEKPSKSKGKDKATFSPRKKRRLDTPAGNDQPVASSSKSVEQRPGKTASKPVAEGSKDSAIAPSSSKSDVVRIPTPLKDGKKKNGAELALLQQMVLGQLEYTPKQELPGTYLAMDCEMVGVGINAEESSLARVSLVNYHGFVILDEYVRQRERVVDYRTQWSGIRESDMVNAKPFDEVQKRVADLLKDRILVGHAVFNDTKALLLSHPWPMTRDTQYYAYKCGLTKSKRPALRVLVKDELGLTIQSGEHSSVTDARATMALYRLHKKEWEKSAPHPQHQSNVQTGKRKRTASLEPDAAPPNGVADMDEDGDEGESDDDDSDDEDDDGAPTASSTKHKSKPNKHKRSKPQPISTPKAFPGGGRKGVSSGLSTVVRRGQEVEKSGKSVGSNQASTSSTGGGSGSSGQWWKELPGGPSKSKSGSKGSIRISR